MQLQNIFDILPYSKPFLFVDTLSQVSEEGIQGEYTFRADEFFYKGHFKDRPVTPGVILTECMAQIGVVSLGIFLLGKQQDPTLQIALSSTEIDFYRPVFPLEKVTVISKKVYFRFNKLKCKVQMSNPEGELIAKGTISGMIVDGSSNLRKPTN